MLKKLLLFIFLIFQLSFVGENYEFLLSNKFKLPQPFYLGGISINEPDEEHFTKLVKEIGMNTVEVTHYAMQGEWDTDDLYIDESKTQAIHKIRLAKAKGLRVVVILRVHLLDSFEKNNFLWHGMIMPGDGQRLKSWFDRYENYVRSWASICEEEGVDVLVIGSELNALSATVPLKRLPTLYAYFADDREQRAFEGKLFKFEEDLEKLSIWQKARIEYHSLENYVEKKIEAQYEWVNQVCFRTQKNSLALMNARRKIIEERWRTIIGECRILFSGQIGYAANFDNYKELGFWDALDFVGINAYFPLMELNTDCKNLKCYEKKCYKSWRNILKEIKEYQHNSNLLEKPIFFTELGYINREHSAVEPWKGFGYSIVDGIFQDKLLIWEEQATNNEVRTGAVKALHRAVHKEKFPLQGILYWRLTSHSPNLEKEPFGLLLNQPSVDPLQDALMEFN